MDLHPLTTPNTILTDCVNGTMITYNDNEFVLQNERGNSKIKISDTEHVELSKGFIPVGMKEHNGILYIVSHNPQTKQSEIGTYPSPNKIQEHGVNLVFEVNGEIKSNYTGFDQNITYYDYNVIVTNQDNYTFYSSHNPLLVLEHFILNKTGEITKTKLIPTEENNVYRFTHEGEGTLGYRYRPYYLSSITPSIIPAKNGSNAQLVIEATSDDKELYALLKNNDTIKFKYNIDIELVSETGDKLKYEVKNEDVDFKSPQSLLIDSWDFTFNLSNVSKLPLQFENKFTINNVNYEYNYRTGEISSVNNENNTIYKEVNFVITPCIYTSINEMEYSIVYDNLKTEYTTTASTVFKQESWFTMFKYTKTENNKLSVYATLDLSRFDVNWETTIHTINEASYKLYEIDKYGNIKGKFVFTPVISYKSPLSNIVLDPLKMNSHDLFLNTEGEFNFKLKTSVDLLPVKYSKLELSSVNVYQCSTLTEDSANKAKYVRYDVVDSKTYNVVLLREDKSIISSTNLWSEAMCSEEMKNMIEEYFDKTSGTVNYTINDIEIKDNKVYLLELTFPINGEINKASFIIVTASKMLGKYDETDLEQRMDEIPLNDWFDVSVDEVEASIKQDDYRNPSYYINNLIDVERIKNKTNDEIEKYAMQFFLKYNQLFTNPSDDEIPALGEQFECEKIIKNTSTFDCTFEYNKTLSLNEFNVIKTIINALSLDVDVEKSKFYTQTSERKYLYDIFNDIKTLDVKSDGAYNEGGPPMSWGSVSSKIKLTQPYGMYTTHENYDYINDKGLQSIYDDYIKKRHGNCGLTSGGEKYRCYSTCENHYGTQIHRLEFFNENFGVSMTLMRNIGLNGGFTYGNIQDLNKYVFYSGKNKKIWLHSKLKDNNHYVLLGIDALNSSKENSKLACNVLLKHGYYTEQCNKQVYQYVFKTENDVIKTKNIKTDNTSISIKIYPCQCNALFNDYSQYNVQNWSNLSIFDFSSNYTIKEFEINDNNVDNENEYKYFLKTLGMLINNNLLKNTVLQAQVIDNVIQFDSMNEDLFIDDVNKINNKEGRSYNNAFYDMTMPELLYDKENKIIYCNIINDTVDQFEYSGGNCVDPLKWNYSIPFDTNDGFWPDGSLDNIEKLNDYHSLLFYKLTAYNGEQS